MLCFNGVELFYLCGGLGGLCFQYAVLFIFLRFGFAQIGVRSKEAKANEESMTPRSPSPLTFPTACMDLNACGWTLSTACTGLCFVIRLRLAWLACVSPPEDCMNLDDINHNTHTHTTHATCYKWRSRFYKLSWAALGYCLRPHPDKQRKTKVTTPIVFY